jgi:hypothetical protein
MAHNYKEKALQALRNSSMPMDIENVRVRAGIKSWVTSKSILLELLWEGKISGQKTTKSWIFWVEENE